LVGFLGTPDDLDISFWRPYGTRQVAQISLYETAEQIRTRKIQYAIISGAQFLYEGVPAGISFEQ
jgi:hypothetical protein